MSAPTVRSSSAICASSEGAAATTGEAAVLPLAARSRFRSRAAFSLEKPPRVLPKAASRRFAWLRWV